MADISARTFRQGGHGEWMQCGRCHRVLEKQTILGQIIWQHPTDMRTFPETYEDHPADPVPLDYSTVEEKCDFCFAPDPGWVLPTHDFFTIPSVDRRQRSVNDWTACDDCADFIRRNDWDGLTEYARKAYHLRRGTWLEGPAYEALREMYKNVRSNVKGELRRNGRG